MSSTLTTSSNEPASSPKVRALLEDVFSNGLSLAHGEVNARRELLVTVRSLFFELETPVEAILRIAWAEPALSAVARVAIELNLFEKLTKDNSISKSTSQLATMTGADPALLGRILKHLSAMGVLREVDADLYASTPLSNALAVPKYRDALPFCLDVCGLPFLNLPKYLAQTGYKNPQNPKDGPFQFAHNTSLQFFDWLNVHPESLEDFNNHMAGYRAGQVSWMDPDCYPVEDLLAKGADQDKLAVLLVDVGGGLGQDIEEFQRKYPTLPGRLILQEQRAIVQEVTKTIHNRIEPMEHDFFTRQPIIGARAYYMRSVLHDWPDNICREILLNLVPALKKGYSKILINENVIPPKGAHWISTGLDMFMMSFSSSRERTEKEWRDLVTSVGLKVVKIWNYDEGHPSLIEVELQ